MSTNAMGMQLEGGRHRPGIVKGRGLPTNHPISVSADPRTTAKPLPQAVAGPTGTSYILDAKSGRANEEDRV